MKTLCTRWCTTWWITLSNSAEVGGEIRFSVTQSKGAVTVAVRNTGEGIAPEALPHVFDRFYKEDKSRGLNTSGAGLGLHICKVLVNLSAGRYGPTAKRASIQSSCSRFPRGRNRKSAEKRAKKRKQGRKG